MILHQKTNWYKLLVHKLYTSNQKSPMILHQKTNWYKLLVHINLLKDKLSRVDNNLQIILVKFNNGK